MAGAEPAVEVAGIGDRHTAQVRADTDHNHKLRFQAAFLIGLLVAKVLWVHSSLPIFTESIKEAQYCV